MSVRKRTVGKKSPALSRAKQTGEGHDKAVGEGSEGGPAVKPSRGAKTPTLLRGMKDILPKEEWFWKTMYRTAAHLAEAYGFEYIETPILEDAALFVRSVGRGTDIVDKEMYSFEDRDGSKVALRPEPTAGVARAYIGHGMHSLSQPVKVWTYGPMFRHDRPQAGRFREFHQFDCETLGERHPAIDAELIVVAYNFLRDLGVSGNVYINSIGSNEDRERYAVELVGYLRTKRSYLCDECKKRITRNPLRVLDCKAEQCVPVIDEAPQIIDWLSDESKDFFMKILEYLDEVEIPYMLKPTLVRGLDYYSDTVFEFYAEAGETTAQSALGGGGRYDGLVGMLGGRPTPAAGFGIGLERVVSVLRRQQPEAEGGETLATGSNVFFAHLGEQARRRVLKLIETLRREGLVVRHNLGKTALKQQLELAHKFAVTHTLILGQKEMQDGTIIIRDMESGNQEIVDQKKIKSEVEKLISQPRSSL